MVDRTCMGKRREGGREDELDRRGIGGKGREAWEEDEFEEETIKRMGKEGRVTWREGEGTCWV